MSKDIITYQQHLEAFRFLGNTNVVDEASDFGTIWGNFFQMGGYKPMLPYAADDKPINVWFHDQQGRTVYFQVLFVKNVDQAPQGYTLMDFPGGDYLAVTTEWMETNQEAVGPVGNGRCNEYAGTPQGSRYEVWVPIQKLSV